MDAQKSNQITGKPGRIPLIACLVLFALYLLNILMGKASISYNLNLPHLGSVGEFILLSMASILLIIAALYREAAEKAMHESNDVEVKE